MQGILLRRRRVAEPLNRHLTRTLAIPEPPGRPPILRATQPLPRIITSVQPFPDTGTTTENKTEPARYKWRDRGASGYDRIEAIKRNPELCGATSERVRSSSRSFRPGARQDAMVACADSLWRYISAWRLPVKVDYLPTSRKQRDFLAQGFAGKPHPLCRFVARVNRK